ncbi:Receptor-interacting serine/threonine-protein kinase 1 [Tritrichomonas musculus]|uniref:Receptor-interacting serine/threonine-protein kinase 1 n=1 Tax=Tritrichomonas musculus TaxID=1915356 RepID=A0ABR2GWL6_9EUKA
MDYIAPEVLKDLKYSKSSDVYSFSIIVYEMFNLKKPYSFIESKKEFITYVVNEKYKPIIYNSCPECYKNLLQRCWSQDPEDRPSFEQILFELKTNPDFITEKINKEEFFIYARMIDEYQASFGSSIEPKAIDDIIKKYSVTSKISDFYLSSTFRPDSD